MDDEKNRSGFDFRDLEVWKLCRDIRREIWGMCHHGAKRLHPVPKKQEATSQLNSLVAQFLMRFSYFPVGRFHGFPV
jgi:hypothetical protein